ncbi:hypothetical protein FIV07_06965 [Mycobacterium sp. THAF192]|nr:hypothetical protein FIV07_06965 [Mycobacterium sp. THAF192]
MSCRGGPLRTLPLLVHPFPGEAIDSWLEAVAARHEVPFGDVLRQCGLVGLGSRRGFSGGFISAGADVIGVISDTTGVPAEAVERTTLPSGEGGAGPVRHPWAWRRGSRACPLCLRTTGGRWMLAWRHNVPFVCAAHNCVLLDTCTACGRPWRLRQHQVNQIPRMNRCANLSPGAVCGSGLMCGADLTILQATALADNHPTIRAQRIVDELYAGRTVSLGVYSAAVPAVVVREDLRVLTRWMLRAADLTALDQLLSIEDAGVLRADHPQLRLDPGRFTQRAGTYPTAIDMAIGTTLALGVLDSPSPAEAKEALSRILAVASPESVLRLVRGPSRRLLTDEVDAVLVGAFNRTFRGRSRRWL